MMSKIIKTLFICIMLNTLVFAQISKSLTNLPAADSDINSGVLLSPENLNAPVTLTQIPTQFYRNNDITTGPGGTGDITIAWSNPNMRGHFYYSRLPNVAANLKRSINNPGYVFPGDSIKDGSDTDNFIRFNVGLDSIPTGVYYCIIVDSLYFPDSTSIEFNLIIEHDSSPSNLLANQQSGVFEWNVDENPNTPYYHVIVSNKPFQLVDDGNGNKDVKGINVIYQAITPNNTIQYRAADPSGYYNNVKSPRLASGNTYYWLVFNNYGNNPALSSDVITYNIVPNFVYDNPQTIQPAPTNIEPVATGLTNLDTLRFEWSSVPGSDYHLYLYEEVEEDNSVGSFLVYDTTIATGDTTLVLNHLKQLLVNTNYYWNVTAEDGNLFSASQVDSFNYSTLNAGRLRIETNSAVAGTPNLGRVNLDIQSIGTSTQSSLTYLTNESGNFNRDLAIGDYLISASKEGYYTLDTTVTITNNDSITMVLNMVGNPTYITGEMRIPSLTVIPKIKLLSPSLGDTVELPGILSASTTSQKTYTYRANVEPGDWTVFPIADGFKAVKGDTADTTLSFGDYVALRLLFMEEIESRIIVNVTDDSGSTVNGVNITFTKGPLQQTVNNVDPPYPFAAEPGIWTVTINKIGFFSQLEQYQIEVFERQDSRLDIIMIEAGAITGTAYDDSGLPLDLVTIQAEPRNALARYAETTTGVNGVYQPLHLKPGDYRIIAHKNGYSDADTLITIVTNQTIEYNPVLVQDKSFITGIVTDTTGSPIAGARVNYLYDMGSGFSAPTDSNGNYLFSVPSNIAIKVYATKTGFSTSDTSYVTVQVNQTDTINFEIFKLNSIVNGYVRTIDQSMLVPMANVIVSAIDTTTKQVVSIDTTNQAGYYKLYADAGTFFIRTRRQFYITGQDTVTLISGDSVTVDFLLNKNYGSLSGRAVDNNQTAIANLIIRAERSTGLTRRDTTNANGEFSFSQLEPGEIYTFNTSKLRHTVSPHQGYSYYVIGGIDTSGFEFTLTYVQIDSIRILNDEIIELQNNTSTKFDYQAYYNGNPIDIEPPRWSVVYPDTMLFVTAQFSNTVNGLFEPKLEALDAGFTIMVEDTGGHSGVIDTLNNRRIISEILRSYFHNPEIFSMELKDHTGMVLIVDSTDIIPGDSISTFKLNRYDVPESKAVSSEAESYGNSYKLAVNDVIAPVILKLPIPKEVSPSLLSSGSKAINVGKWNNNFLDWEILANSDFQSLPYYAVSNTISVTGEYIVLVTSQPLGIHNLKILPNPFSPNLINYNDPLNRSLIGQVIAFDLTSLDIRKPFVTLRIFNMNGELIRDLADNEPITKGQVAIIWDGKTNSGRLARNGRYIVHLKVKDSTGEKEEIKSSVLIK